MISWLLPRNILEKIVPPEEKGEPGPHSILIAGATQPVHAALGWRTWSVARFPFTIGRATSKPQGDKPCDLVMDDHEPYQISRNHCSILWVATLGGFFVQDNSSKLGTVVNGLHIGRHSTRQMAALKKGENELILGGDSSPYKLTIRLPKAMF